MSTVEHWSRADLVHPDGRHFHMYGEFAGTLDSQSADTGLDVSALHRRFDRLTGSWVLVSPARNSRPGGLAVPAGPATSGGAATSAGEPVCPLCPGGPELPWPYDVAVFDNRFPSLSVDATQVEGSLLSSSGGRCQVVVYTADHHGSLATLSPAQILRVLAVWRDRSAGLWAEGHHCVMAFENRGAAVGATLTHPHGQLFAVGHLPPTIVAKAAAHHAHRDEEQTCLGCTLLDDDLGSARVIAENAAFVAAVPYAARWPYEVQIRARRHGLGRLPHLRDDELRDLAAVLRASIQRLDGLFGFEMPLMMAVQEAPAAFAGDTAGEPDWHLHMELLPPHRSAERLKVRASSETVLGLFINDTLPEESARRLRSVVVAAPIAWGDVAVPQIVAQ